MSERVQRRLAAILVADIAGYSRLMEADEEGTLARLKFIHRDIVEPLLSSHGGRLISTAGDGFLAEFPSAVDAARAAVAIQRGVAQLPTEAVGAAPLQFRIGINLGDVMADGDDIHGDGVNIAARLESIAEPGGICLSRPVRDQIGNRLGLPLTDLGPVRVKNISQPVHVFSVAMDGRPRRARLSGRYRRPALVLALVAPLIAVTLAAVWALKPFGLAMQETARTAPALSIVVLPFADLSDVQGRQWFADGVTDDLITDLSRISGAFVIARSSAFTYQGRAVDVRQVARELDVRYVLEGSVRSSGEQVRVNATLVDGQTGARVWSDRFDGNQRDWFSMQNDITGRIARALNVELKEEVSRRVARIRPENIGAADLATTAWVLLFNKPQTRQTNEEALPLLERALQLDPQNVEAWTGMAYLHTRAALYGWSPSRAESQHLALEAGEKAVDLDPRSADAHYVLGFAAHVGNELVRARQMFERCLDLNPNFAPAYFWLGWVEIFEGHPERAPPLVQRAFRLSPRDGLSGVWRTATATAYVLTGDDVAAIREARLGIADNPQHPNNHAVLAAALAHDGKAADASAALEKFYEARGGPITLAEIVRVGRPTPEVYRQRFGRYLDGLKKAGMPEG